MLFTHVSAVIISIGKFTPKDKGEISVCLSVSCMLKVRVCFVVAWDDKILCTGVN